MNINSMTAVCNLKKKKKKCASGPTASLSYFCNSLSPDAVDGNEHALSGLHRVEHSTLHSSVAGATHWNGHVVLCLKGVPDPFFDFIHDLRNTHPQTSYEQQIHKIYWIKRDF